MVIELVFGVLLLIGGFCGMYIVSRWFFWETKLKSNIAIYKIGRLNQIAEERKIDIEKIRDTENTSIGFTERIEDELSKAVKDIETLKEEKKK